MCFTGAPLVFYPLTRLGQRLRKTTRRSQEELEHLSHVSAEAFTGHRIVKAFATEKREAGRFAVAADRLYRANMKVTAALSALPPIMELLGGLGMAAALWYGAKEIAAKELTGGEFSSFLAALFLMYGPAKKLSRVNASLQQATAASERIFEILDTHSEVVDRPGAATLTGVTRGIEFHDVGFHYDDDRTHKILRGVSLNVRAGEMVAIVGRSGAGKTTLVNLLPRFYDVTSGAITIDGIDIRDVTLASLRSQIGIVTQETVLFDDTIAGNIAYGSPNATRDADRGGGPGGPCARVHRGDAERVSDDDRRARAAAVGRPAAAAGDRARAAEGLADPDPRRGDVVARLRVGAPGPGGAGEPDGQPDVDRDRAPAVDGAAGRA